MDKQVTVVFPYAYTVKWLQICLTSLYSFKDFEKFNTLIMFNSSHENSIQGYYDTDLFILPNVKVVVPPTSSQWHAGSLDYAIDLIDTPYMFTTESDCRAMKEGWLDRFVGCMRDDWVAVAGWFWDVGDDRQYINSSGTIYNTNILKRIKNEVLRNDNQMCCYGPGLSLRHAFDRFEMWKSGNWGPFSEQRGFQEVFSHRPDKFWQEPGAWLYYRLQSEYECIRIPGEWVVKNGVAAGTYYGGRFDPYFVHYWGGTVSHNWQKHPVRTPWELEALPWWIEREDKLWNEVVDKKVREKTLELGLCKTGDEEKQYIMNHPNVKAS